MKVYLDKRGEAIARIDSIVTGEYGERELDVRQVRNVINGLELLGKKVEKITLESGCYVDMDKPCYNRYPKVVVIRVYNKIANWRCGDVEVKLKGNRLYVTEGKYDVILPKDIRGWNEGYVKMTFHYTED